MHQPAITCLEIFTSLKASVSAILFIYIDGKSSWFFLQKDVDRCLDQIGRFSFLSRQKAKFWTQTRFRNNEQLCYQVQIVILKAIKIALLRWYNLEDRGAVPLSIVL